ncbi:unnamed protein product [Enterobius vermicularis]|uniref:Uncharacterized protein n=1 Tax=Enterobius vermicularis TaxID=51028 RepID=A0A0N4UXI4_ENTVE|nr:unnamed protein product [Enterobius vermicularis]
MSASKRKAKSPMWLNPRDVMKRHLKRRSRRCLLTETLASSSAPNLDITNNAGEHSVKFGSSAIRPCNPFKCSSSEEILGLDSGKENTDPLSFESEDALLEFPSNVFGAIKEDEKKSGEKKRLKPHQASFIESSFFFRWNAYPRMIFQISPVPPTSREIHMVVKLIFLKRRHQGNYQVRVTGLEYDVGIHILLHDEKDCRQANLKDAPCTSVARTNSLAGFEAGTFYWEFPNIPWMMTYPRLDVARRFVGIKKEKAPSINSLGKVFVEGLNVQWVGAFTHLFFSWKKGTRPYFYLCCPNFTVFFSKMAKENCFDAGENSQSGSAAGAGYSLIVMISPTTSGFRQQLREEGINFELPLRQSSRRSSFEREPIYFGLDNETFSTNDSVGGSLLSTKSDSHLEIIRAESAKERKSPTKGSTEGAFESEDEQDASGDSDHATWLQEIGFSPKFKRRLTRELSLSSFNEKSLMESAMADMSHQSGSRISSPTDISKTVVVVTEPASIQALFDFLNESKLCHPITGSSAGLPPTLLSDKPFLHATLKNLTKMSRITRSEENESKYICELTNGPVMPHMISQLNTFLTTCPSLNFPENRLKVRVYGRNFYAALNQVCGYDGAGDYNLYEYVFNENLYYIS